MGIICSGIKLDIIVYSANSGGFYELKNILAFYGRGVLLQFQATEKHCPLKRSPVASILSVANRYCYDISSLDPSIFSLATTSTGRTLSHV